MATNFDIKTSEGSQNTGWLAASLVSLVIVAGMVASRFIKTSSKKTRRVGPTTGEIVENIRGGRAAGRGVQRALNTGPFTSEEIAARTYDRRREEEGRHSPRPGGAGDVVGGIKKGFDSLTTTLREIKI